jgi:5-methylcytosine-specific restriction endonuclease McrA
MAGSHWRPHAIFRERGYLVDEYVVKLRSCRDIAGDHGVHENAILHWLSKHGIKRRTTAECRKAKRWGLRGADNPMYGCFGSRNPRWVDGSSPERQSAYARCFWKEIARAVLDRDGHRCVRCHAPRSVTTRIHAHHIRPWAGNPESRFSLSNIVSVCEACHRWIHSKRNVANELLSRR